jgi:flagellar hook-associated protein 1 FlgK
MGLSSSLATAMSGLRANQAALSIISSNVSNAQTPGYVAQNPNQIEVSSGDFGSTIITTGVNRQLDLFVQNQLRTETGGSGYATQISNILGQLQSVYGTPGGEATLETALNNFTTALQSLSNNPGNFSRRALRCRRPNRWPSSSTPRLRESSRCAPTWRRTSAIRRRKPMPT